MSINLAGEHSIKYLDVYNDLKEAILSGKYLKGSFLPTETGLTEMYDVSRTTVRKAVSLLQSDGLVNVQQGRGTEVTCGKSQIRQTGFSKFGNVMGVSSRFLKEGPSVWMSSVVDMIEADSKIADILDVNIGTPVYRVQRLKLQAETPFSYVVSYVPADLAPGLERFSGQMFYLYQCLKDNYGVVSTSIDESITAETAKFLESNLLAVPVGAALLISKRLAWCEGRVMEYCETCYRPDMYNIVISMEGDIDYINSSDHKL